MAHRLTRLAVVVVLGLLDQLWLALLRRHAPAVPEAATGHIMRLGFGDAQIYVQLWQGVLHLVLLTSCFAALAYALWHMRRR